MQRALTSIGIIAALCLAGSAAHSGEKATWNVVVNTGVRVAYGSIGAARNSADTYQKLWCWVWSTESGESGGCYARDNNLQVSALCNTLNPILIEAIRGLESDAYVEFRWDAGGMCTSIRNQNGSMYQPKVL